MAELLKSYGIWIFLGLLFLLMLRSHGKGMGCGMGGHRHNEKTNPKGEVKKEEEQPKSAGHSSGCL